MGLFGKLDRAKIAGRPAIGGSAIVDQKPGHDPRLKNRWARENAREVEREAQDHERRQRERERDHERYLKEQAKEASR